MVFSGGVGLGAYQAGAYAALHRRTDLTPTWIAASSVGSVNAAIIAGRSASERLGALEEFWRGYDTTLLPQTFPEGRTRHVQNWLSALATRLMGARGYFRPRLPNLLEPFASLYDLTPMRLRLEKLVDFDRLNSGAVRVCVSTTDIETGELVVFDTARGDRIGMDHLLASCGFLPEFAPVEINGRLLGDGGLSANAPVETVLLEDPDGVALIAFVVDLFARDGKRPTDLETAVARKNDLLFGNQTFLRLEACLRERKLRRKGAGKAEADAVYYLSYRAPPEEAGPEKPYDLSVGSVHDRWMAGELDMAEALAELDAPSRAGPELKTIRRSDCRRR